MALAEPWADAATSIGTDGQGIQTDTNSPSGMTDTSVTETRTDIAIVPDTAGMDVEIWGTWWPLHRYGFASLFLLLSVYAMYATILRIVQNQAPGGGGRRSRKAVQPVFTSINIMVFLLGLSNSIMLFFDPYLFYQRLPLIVSVILINVPYPCMTSAFALVNWVLFSISRMKMTKTSRLRSAWFLALIILFHFVLIISASVILVFYVRLIVLGILCHGFFVVWGVLLCVTYVYSAWKIMSAEKTNRKALYDISVRGESTAGSAESKRTSGGSFMSCRLAQRISVALSRSVRKQSNKDKDVYTIPTNGNVKQPTVPPPASISSSDESKLTTIGESDDVATTMTQAKPGQPSTNAKSDVQTPETSASEVATTRSTTIQHAVSNANENNGQATLTASEESLVKADRTETPTANNCNRGKSNSSAVGTQSRRLAKQSGAKMSGMNRPQNVTTKVFRISAMAAFLGLSSAGLGLYGICGLMVASPGDQPPPWGWFAFQTLFRFVELGMGCTMAYFTTQPFPRKRHR